jgi:hypothetical protein
MKKNKFLLAFMLVTAFSLAMTGCEQDADDDVVGADAGAGAGDEPSEEIKNLPDFSEEIKNLPDFKGIFVENETEARKLSTVADTKIQGVFSSAIGEITGQIGAGDQTDSYLYEDIDFSAFKSLYQQTMNGEIDSHGIKAEYTFTIPDDITASSKKFKINMKGSIDGTYDGYEIKGNFALTSEVATKYSNEALTIDMKYVYDMSYSVSYRGEGMKVVSNTTMEISETITSLSATGTYSIYDNDGVLRFSYNYPSNYKFQKE